MSLRALIVPVALLVSAPVLAQDAAKGAQLDVPEFHGVAVSHGIRAEVKPGAKAVRLEGKAEDVARVKLEVKDGVLTTQVSKEKGASFFSKGLKDVRLYVTSPRVESVSASGGAHVEAEATRVDTFEVAASGGSEINVTQLDSKKLDAAASGGAQLSLKGRADELELQGSGGSVIEARELRAEKLEVQASGGTRVEAAPSKSIEASLSGGSTVKAGSKPEHVQVNASGGSAIQYE